MQIFKVKVMCHGENEDLKAMFAYLQSTEPVGNVVPAPIPPDKLASLQKK